MNNRRILRALQAALLAEMVFFGVGARPTGDDGFYITTGDLVARGLTPFIDFPYSQGPLGPYLLAPVLALFGSSALAGRIFGVAFLGLCYWASLKVAEAIWRRSWPGESDLTAVTAAVTVTFMLFPEVLGALGRVGSKESAAALCCVLAVGGVALFPERRWHGVLIAGLFTGLSIGIKYTSGLLLLPVVAFLLLSGKFAQAAAYGAATAATVALFLGPYAIAGRFDAVVENFVTVVKLQTDQGSVVSHALAGVVPTIFALLRLAARFQVLLLAAVAWIWWETTRDGLRAVLTRVHTLLPVAFVGVTAATYLAVSPGMPRAYMFVPLLFIYSAIAIVRLWIERPRPTAGLVGALAALMLFINVAFLQSWAYNETGFSSPSFTVLRYRPPAELRSLCAQRPEELLYVGVNHNFLLEAGCRLSPYSLMAVSIDQASAYPIERARRYKVLTHPLLLEMASQKEAGTIVLDQRLLVDGGGAAYASLDAALQPNYDRQDIWFFTVYTSKAASVRSAAGPALIR